MKCEGSAKLQNAASAGYVLGDSMEAKLQAARQSLPLQRVNLHTLSRELESVATIREPNALLQ